MAGRPSKLTPEVQEKILEALRKGNYRVVAVKYAGIGMKTFCQWMKRGLDEAEDESSIYVKFRQAVLETESRVEMEAVGILSDKNANDPKRLIEWLARKFPERWGSDHYKLKLLERELAEIKKLISVIQGSP